MLDKIWFSFLAQFQALDWSLNWLNIFEFTFIAIVILIFYKKCIKNTQSEKLIRGIVFLFIAWAFSEFLMRIDLKIIGVFIKTLVMFISLSLIVIFQPELRRFLGYLGQAGFVNMLLWGSNETKTSSKVDVLKEILEAVKYLSKTKTGALIVFQKEIGSPNYFDVGTLINANISTELILTIFHPNTPLHDGAMIVKNNKIISAGVLLPLTEDPKLSWKYGTRHRAAIGMTEVSDSACLVVSEETGDISVSLDGVLKKYDDLTTLKQDLENILGIKVEEENKKTIFKINNIITIKKNKG